MSNNLLFNNFLLTLKYKMEKLLKLIYINKYLKVVL